MKDKCAHRIKLLVTVILAVVVAACGSPPALSPVATAPPRRPLLAEVVTGPHLFGWLINGDDEARHHGNVDAAARALCARGALETHVRISDSRRGNATVKELAAVAAALAEELHPDDQLVVYVTGHGTREGVVLQNGELLGRAGMLEVLRPLRAERTVFVFDGCFTGDIPTLLVEDGFRAVAMAPIAEGQESHCQLFAPAFWGGLELGLVGEGQGPVSLREVFQRAMDAYNAGRRRHGLPPVPGTYMIPLQEARTVEEVSRGCAVVELSAEWCEACRYQRRELSAVDLYRDDGVQVFTIDIERGPLRAEAPRLIGNKTGSLPVVAILKDGRGLDAGPGVIPAAEVLERVKQHCGIDLKGSARVRALLARRLEAPDGVTRAAAVEALLRVEGVDDALVRAFGAMLEAASQTELDGLVKRLVEAPSFFELVGRLSAPLAARVWQAKPDSFEASLKLAIGRLSARDAKDRILGAMRVADLEREAQGRGPLRFVPALKPLGMALIDPDLEVRRTGVAVLGRLLASTDLLGRYWYAARRGKGLSWEDAEEGRRSVVDLLRDVDPAVRAGATLMGGVIHDRELTARLRQILVTDPSPWVRIHAARSLGMLAEDESLVSLVKALDDHDTTVRAAAAEAIAWKSLGRDKRALKAAMARREHQAGLARGFGLLFPVVPRQSDPELFPVLLELFDKERFWAGVALVNFDDSRVLPALLERARDRDPKLRALAIWALAKLPDSAAAAAVRAALDDKDEEVRKAAIHGMQER